jgi:hypothetical protein
MAVTQNESHGSGSPAEATASAGSAGSTDAPAGVLDLTKDPLEIERVKGISDPLQTPPFDLVQAREKMRGRLALILVLVLAGIVIAAFIYALISLFILKTFRDLDTLKTVLEILFAPVVGLVGSVTGFYFGEKSKS